jgi:hypothetical protein
MHILLPKKYFLVLFLSFFFVLAGLSNTVQADTSMTPKVKEVMRVLKSWSKMLGPVRLEGEELYFGITHINIDFYIVDGLKNKYGSTVTFFAKKGDGFIRISTNVMKDNGERAVGTMLDPNGPVISQIKQGKPFYGIVDILGKKYDTGYEPIFTAAGEVIGIYYVGYKLE